MPRAHPPKAVIFDLDGVLLDTERLYTAATESVASQYGRTFDFGLKSQLMGRSATESAARLLEALDLPLSVEEYLEQRGRILLPMLATACAMPGAESLVRWLHETATPIAIATSSHRELYTLKTQGHTFFELISTVVCGDDPRLGHPKPAPDIFLLAARELRVPPGDCLVVEDSPAGAQAAVAAGMQLVVVADPRLEAHQFPDKAHLVRKHERGTYEKLGIGATSPGEHGERLP